MKRTIIGHKISTTSQNNYLLVRDLEEHFKQLEEENDVDKAEKKSISNLDVNTIQYLIFNGVKYVLKNWLSHNESRSYLIKNKILCV